MKKRKPREDIPSSDFRYEIQQRMPVRKKKGVSKGKKRYKWVVVPEKKYRTNKETRIYVVHKRTGQKRLRAFGKFRNLPIYGHHPDLFSKGKELGGKWFIPTEGKPKRHGKWVPTSEIVGEIQKELEEYGQDYKHEVRGVVIPAKNYYHRDWQLYSDTIHNGNEYWKATVVNCVVEYVYTNQQWIGKRSIILDLRPGTNGKGVKAKNLHKYTDRWEFELEERMDELKQNRRGEVNIIAINGYSPVTYLPGSKQDED